MLAKGNRVLGVGFNKPKTHPKLKTWSYVEGSGIHAEMSACLGLGPQRLVGSSIHVARLLRNGEWGLAKPCFACQNFLRHAGVRSMFYTVKPGEWGKSFL